ncbi:MAG TPA: hypothetical protein PLC52_01570 [Anaerolineales bacterium]|nr:hypothetical protein [Anaerolineales bacterium]HRQ91542.1 hypothetical protein [Anaerolineales bacterium]
MASCMFLMASSRDPPAETMKVQDIIRPIEEDGWYLVATKGSHRQ